MNLKGPFIIIVLASGLLLSSVAGAAEPIQRSTDDQGTIRIGTPTKNEKADEKTGEPKASPEAAKTGQSAPQEPPPPGLLPSHSRRGSPAAAAARQKAFEQSHPSLVSPSKKASPGPAPTQPGVKTPPASPTQPESESH